MAQRRVRALSFVLSLEGGSLLGTKMVKEAFGTAGKDIGIGTDVLRRAALPDEFAGASGRYFDNDIYRFASPNPDAFNNQKVEAVVQAIEAILTENGVSPTDAHDERA